VAAHVPAFGKRQKETERHTFGRRLKTLWKWTL